MSRGGEERPFFSTYVAAGEVSEPIPLASAKPQTLWRSLASYAEIGFVHIVQKGRDQTLFVIGLFLLSQNFRPLLWQIIGFALAHSITLTLGVYGLVRIRPGIVEPLIAASIVFIAVENLFTDRLRVWRRFVVFGFGLLHGLGFAGAPMEIGLPRDQFVTALIGFNTGVELGQSSVIASCFPGRRVLVRHWDWYRRAIAIPTSANIALTATFWFFERKL